jgi:HSP20 family molecular chaperone IbpA
MNTSIQTTEPQGQVMEPEADRVTIPRADVWEEGDALVLYADMPGVNPASLDVSVEAGVLTVHGRRAEPAPEGAHLTHQEYEPRSYHRVFKVGSEVDLDHVEARVKNGVLTLRLPKSARVKARRIPIAAA